MVVTWQQTIKVAAVGDLGLSQYELSFTRPVGLPWPCPQSLTMASSTSPGDTFPFRFLDLPSEIRLIIYAEYAKFGRMVVPNPVANFACSRFVDNVCFEIDALTLVNKAIRQEIICSPFWSYLTVAACDSYIFQAPDDWEFTYTNTFYRHQKLLKGRVQYLEINQPVSPGLLTHSYDPSAVTLKIYHKVNDFPALRRLQFYTQVQSKIWDQLLGRPVDGAEKTSDNYRLGLLARPDLCLGVWERIKSIRVRLMRESLSRTRGSVQHFVSLRPFPM